MGHYRTSFTNLNSVKPQIFQILTLSASKEVWFKEPSKFQAKTPSCSGVYIEGEAIISPTSAEKKS